MEISQKYNLEMIEELAQQARSSFGNFFDENRYFVDSLWKIS